MIRTLIALIALIGIAGVCIWPGVLAIAEEPAAENGPAAETPAAEDGPAETGPTEGEVADEDRLPEVGPEFAVMQRAPVLFVGVLKNAQAGPVAMSQPPIHTFMLTFEVDECLRGRLKTGKSMGMYWKARQVEKPVFTEGEKHVVAAHVDVRAGARLAADWVGPGSVEMMAEARLAGSLPMGWLIADDKLLSPWAALGEKAWPKDAGCGEGGDGKKALACGKTGRPALLAGNDIKLTSEKVPPKEAIKWTNPDGDGEYTITVTNTTDEAADVPALLSDDSGILWNESLVIICQKSARPAPLAEGVSGETKPTRLEAGESVSTVINALRLANVAWPRGGYRIAFTFCLGELATAESFYYLSRHHDVIREGLKESE
ncbi:MAG: hypothetical protein ACYS8X_01130 [Planctomycetota bacterium]|jgi:hypothetical protein